MRRILVPTDFSDHALGALRRALALAERYRAEVHLLHVLTRCDPVPHAGTESAGEAAAHENKLEDIYRSRARTLLREVVAEEHRDAVVVDAVIRQSMAVAPAILRYAREAGIDLIVAGTHGRRGMKHWVLGSVAEEVMHGATCPVLLVHRHDDEAARDLQHILIPIDFSVPSREALRYAASLAGRFGATLHLLHVIEPLPFPVSLTGVLTVHDLVPGIDAKARQHVQEMLDEVRQEGLKAAVHVEEGYPAASITRMVEDLHIDLVVIASSGVAGLERLLVGSVTMRVVRAAPCPVLVVRASYAGGEDPSERVAARSAV